MENGQTNYNKSPVTNGEYPVDTTVSFTCNYGYMRTGSTSSTCQTSGNWTEQSPTCMQGIRITKLSWFLHDIFF